MKLDKYDKCFLVFVLVISVAQWLLFADFKHIPGPVFGGDLYRERGFVQHILNGESYRVDPYFKGELEFYPPIGYVLAAKIVQVTGWDLEWVLNHFPIVVFVLQSIAFYVLGQVLFQDKAFAFVLVGIVSTIHFVAPKHTYGIAMALAVFCLAQYASNIQQPSRKKQVLAGVFLGLAGLTHYSAFLIAAMILGIGTICELVYRTMTEKKFLSVSKELVNNNLITAVIGVALAAFFLYPLYAQYHFATPNKTQIYSLFNPYAHGIEWVIGQFWNTLFPLSFLRKILGVLTLLGVFLAWKMRARIEYRTPLFWLVALLVGTAHFVITIPLLNTSIVPPHLYGGIYIPTAVLSVFGLRSIAKTASKYTNKPVYLVLVVFSVLIILPLLSQQYAAYQNDHWVQYGKTMDPAMSTMYRVKDWILAHSTTNDVFLAHDESSFAINALTGRKLVAVRRTHASPYVDVDKRYADAFIMMYGTNTTKIQELIQDYGVRYLYVDQFLVGTPMVTSVAHAEYVRQHGVNFTTGKSRYDPASTDTPLYDVIIVQGQPQAILNLSKGQQVFSVGNQLFSVLYTF